MILDVNKLNFTVGPVMMDEDIKEIGMHEVPYFRTESFSDMMFESEKLMKEFVYASDKSRSIFLTGSGTAAMEAAVINTLTEKDKVLIVNGGSFGMRFVKICQIHHIPYEEILLQPGKGLQKENLQVYENRGFTAFLVNQHETSTGVLYDMNIIADFCRRNDCFLIVDAISSFIADPLYMEKWGVNIIITGSQKALALPPGISILVLDEQAIRRVQLSEVQSMYFDLRDYLENGLRGQTPFTPAVGIFIQLNYRLNQLKRKGLEEERNRIVSLASYFRKGLEGLPVTIFSDSLSNAVTPIRVRMGISADAVFKELENNYHIWVCPNGGDLKEKVFRVGHIGALSIEDNKQLLQALSELAQKGEL